MKDKLITYSFIIFIFIFMILGIFIKDKEVSTLERRKLTTSVGELDSYLVDQFPFRDNLINTKSIFLNKVYLNKINHNVVDYNNNLFEIDSKVNEKSVKHLINKISTINNLYDIKNAYFIMIPDKNYYVDNYIPKMDYNYMEDLIKSNLDSNISYIDILDTLSLDSYYLTDIHFKQDKLDNLVYRIKDNLNLKEVSFTYTKYEYSPFYGSLYSKGSNKSISDKITILYDEGVYSSSVYNYELDKYTTIYDKNNFKNIDKYDIFLDGASGLVNISNNSIANGRELVMFRDSFSSTLAPLLIKYYKKITLIDLRYISSMNLKNNVDININSNTDVLFIYSIPVINNSFSIK